MEIVEIYKPWIYSIQFDEEDLNEYDRLFDKWHDLDFLTDFFTRNADFMDNPIWKSIGLSADEPEKSAERIIDEADKLEEYIERLVANADKGEKPDLKDNVMKKIDAVLAFLKREGITEREDI